MTREIFWQMIRSIVVGACVAFISALASGVLHFLQGHGADLAGAAVGAIHYAAKSARYIV